MMNVSDLFELSCTTHSFSISCLVTDQQSLIELNVKKKQMFFAFLKNAQPRLPPITPLLNPGIKGTTVQSPPMTEL